MTDAIPAVCPNCQLSWTRRPLTKRQTEILEYLRDSIRQNGFAPSFPEIAARFQFASLATVAAHIDTLEAKGYLARRYREARSIQLIDGPPAALKAGQP